MEAIQKKAEKQRKIPPKPIDPIGSILNHLPMVLIIFASILIIGTGTVIIKVKPFYSSEAILKIEPVVPKILYGKEEASIMPYYDDFVRTQINIAKSFPVLSSSIQIYQEKGHKWQLPAENLDQAVERLAARLKIMQLRDTQLFSLSMTSRRNEGLAELINAVATAYLDSNRNEQFSKDASSLTFIKKRKKDIENELDDKYAVLQKISAKYAVGITDEKNIYVYLQAIVDLTQQLVKATSRRIEVESKLQELKKQMERLKTIDISADIDDWIEKDWAIRDNRIQLSRKLQDMRLILAGVNENHPDRKEYKENLKKLYEVQENLLKRAQDVGEKVLRGKLISDQNKKILELETEYAAAVNTEKKLRSELTEAERKATDVNTQMMQASTLRKDIQRLQDSLLRIDERIDQIEVESRSSGRIKLITPARKPERPSAGKRSKMMIVVLLFSLMSGIGYAVARDRLDDKVHSTQDIARVLGFPATGYIMEALQDQGTIDDPYRVVLEHPFSPISEQYKEISLALTLEHINHKSSIYTCFSMAQGQGTSSFLTNTLSALKGHREKKILVDLNVWNPLSKTLGVDSRQGLWEVLEGEIELKDAIVTDSNYPFHILPFGSWQQDDKSIFQEVGMDTIIEILRMDYEYIMVDSPPLLLTTDSKFLAQVADVVILVVSAGEVREKELFRAVNILDKIDVDVISVVLNRVKLKRGKYYRTAIEKYHRLIRPNIGKRS